MKFKAEGVLINAFFFLFFVSFIKSKEILILTGILTLIWSVIVLKKFKFFKLILPVLPFIILMLLSLLINFSLNGNMDDLRFYVFIMSKIALSSIVLSTITEKHSALYLLEGILNLGFPQALNKIFSLTFRYFYMINSDIQIGHKAMQARGISNRKGFGLVYIFGEWIGGFFLKSSIHAESVYKAMLSRGFGSEDNRVIKRDINIVRLLLLIIIFIVFIVIDRSIYSGYFN